MEDPTTMSITNIAVLQAEGEVTITFYNADVDQHSCGPPPSAPTGVPRPPPAAGQPQHPTASPAPPPPGGSARRPGSGASPSYHPDAHGSTRRDHGPVPT